MATSEQTPAVSPIPTGDGAPFSLEEIHRSCRGPILFLFFHAAIWLVVASVFALIASIKLHKGSFLAGCPFMTYGRMQPAATTMFLYGFACQAAFGVALWLLARLGRTLLIGGKTVLIATKFWNLGLIIGVIGIFAGDSSGYQGFELPRYSVGILFFSYLAIAAAGLLTFAKRRERGLYVSQWFIFAALLIFAWLFSTANALLHFHPARGMMQVVVSSWFASGFFQLWLAPVALAALFYLVPKLADKPLYSSGLAAVSFWLLILIAGWCGIAPGARLPAWMPSVSTVASVLLIIPALSFAANWYLTFRDSAVKCSDLIVRFTSTGGLAYVLTILLGAVVPFFSQLEFTHFNTAISQLGLYAFFAMTMFASIYFIAPQLANGECCPKAMKAHYILSKLGILLIVGGLIGAGIKQGNAVPGSIASVKASVPFIGIMTGGLLFLLGAHIAFLLNLLKLLRSCCKSCCCSGKNEGSCS